MAQIVVAVNQTAGALPLDQLTAPDAEIPGPLGAEVELTANNWNSVDEIINDNQLFDYISTGQVVLRIDGVLLDMTQSLNAFDPILGHEFDPVATRAIIGPNTSVPGNIVISDDVTGTLARDDGISTSDLVTVTGTQNLINKRYPVRTVTANSDTVTIADRFIFYDASAGNIFSTLPTAVGNDGVTFLLKKIDNSTNFIQIQAQGSQQLDGLTSRQLFRPQSSIQVVSDGSNWQIVG